MTAKVTTTIAREVTEWFPAEVKPVREGVYQTSMVTSEGYCYWNGERWANQRPTAKGAEECWLKFNDFGFQKKRWRGLRSPA